MSELPMRGHFQYLRFKTFSMTPRTPQCEVFCPLLSSSEHSGVPKDSKSPLFQVLGFIPTLDQVRVATHSDWLQMTRFLVVVVHPTLIVFLKIFIQKLKLPFMLKEKPFISYSLSIVIQYP
jgi:Na+-translocating ferredoxin:NAD+ oxidoreductase RnfE subunit